MTKHVAIFVPEIAELLLNGIKTIESRFSKSKIAPFGVISSGDIVYIKPSGKDIIGQFRVKKVITFDGLNSKDIKALKEQFGQQIAVLDRFWKEKESSKFATLIFVSEVTRFLTSPIRFHKRDQRGWVVLG